MKIEPSPKVSVIMPVYNGASFVEMAINSLLSQSFQDWELVVVDDGSTDATPQILDGYSDARIRVIRQENAGEASARNTGLNHIHGEYVAFLDADDEYLPNALEDLSQFLDRYPEYDVAFSDGQICDSAGKFLMRLDEIRPGIYFGNILEPLILSSSVVTVPICTMTRASKIHEYAIRFDRNLIIGPDWDFWIQLAVHVGFGHLPKLTCKYRIHEINITKTTNSNKRKKDRIYGRMKIMNSSWFAGLSVRTLETFFLDFLVNIASGDSETQIAIMQSKQFGLMPVHSQSYLWRMAGIDILQNSRDRDTAKRYFLESLNLNSDDYKTRFVLFTLWLGTPFALAAIQLWRLFLQAQNRISGRGSSSSIQLQKLFGMVR